MYFVRVNAGSQMALYQARAEVERLAAEQERMRIARDLHDLLGHALTTVVVKSELAARLATIDPARAAAEMTEVAGLARQGLDDVRATVSGYREVSLVNELATAREVLRAAGIQAELPASTESVPGELRELFGWVVREGVTNAVRHSRAAHLQITLHGRGIAVEDDGIGGESAARAAPGNGLSGLRERAAAVGGLVTAGRSASGGWSLTVDVPK
jgi:two-component system sensor histidine kinase DesK